MMNFFPSTIMNAEGGEGPDYSNATIAHSIQKVNPSYSGPCWTVRRISDGSTLPIGFDSSGIVSESELSTFLGTGIGRLVAFHDQIGTNDATAPSTGLEPLIWNNGFITFNGHPTIDFEGTGTLRKLVFTSEIELVSANGSFGIIGGRFLTNTAQGIMGHVTLNRQYRGGQVFAPDNANIGFLGSPNDMAPVSGTFVGIMNNHGFEVYKAPNQVRLFAQTLNGSLTTYTATTWKLNQYGAVLNVIPYGGYLSEFLFWNDITVPIIADVKSERIAYFS